MELHKLLFAKMFQNHFNVIVTYRSSKAAKSGFKLDFKK